MNIKFSNRKLFDTKYLEMLNLSGRSHNFKIFMLTSLLSGPSYSPN